jgi:cytidylate kinase
VARRLGLRHLDTGSLYRALTHALLEAGIDPDRWPELESEHLAELGVSLEPGPGQFSIERHGRTLDRELRTPAVTGHVSRVAALPAVRGWLLEIQRSAARLGGLVADGRDLGSVVFPDADLKFFLTADLDERARRRLGDQGVKAPGDDEIQEEARRLQSRDRTDASRAHAPLTRPPDAVVLDTTRLDFDDQVETIVREVRDWDGGRRAGEDGGDRPRG